MSARSLLSLSALSASVLIAITGALNTAARAPADTAALGLFSGQPSGVSVFTEQGSGINARGGFTGLDAKRSYFTVAYGNAVCDPAQAFPVGPFLTDKRGNATLNQTVANPAAVDLNGTGSISIRIGDTDAQGKATDQDGDGLTGPNDVVAVAGNPGLGLVVCDGSAFTN